MKLAKSQLKHLKQNTHQVCSSEFKKKSSPDSFTELQMDLLNASFSSEYQKMAQRVQGALLTYHTGSG